MKGGSDCLCLLSSGGIRIEQFVTNCVGERLPCNYVYVSYGVLYTFNNVLLLYALAFHSLALASRCV